MSEKLKFVCSPMTINKLNNQNSINGYMCKKVESFGPSQNSEVIKNPILTVINNGESKNVILRGADKRPGKFSKKDLTPDDCVRCNYSQTILSQDRKTIKVTGWDMNSQREFPPNIMGPDNIFIVPVPNFIDGVSTDSSNLTITSISVDVTLDSKKNPKDFDMNSGNYSFTITLNKPFPKNTVELTIMSCAVKLPANKNYTPPEYYGD